MRRYLITLDGERFAVEVLDDPHRNPVRVRVNGELFNVTVEEERERSPHADRPQSGQVSSSGPGVLTAPLPGVVKSLAVRTGQEVSAGEELLVIEAMKMDNVIRASHGGTVSRIYVAEGRQVAYGERLLEIGGAGGD